MTDHRNDGFGSTKSRQALVVIVIVLYGDLQQLYN